MCVIIFDNGGFTASTKNSDIFHKLRYLKKIINPKNSIRQIANTTKMNDLEIRRIVYGLLQAGLVELIRPEGAVLPVRVQSSAPDANPEEQKSLVNRLITRIRSL